MALGRHAGQTHDECSVLVVEEEIRRQFEDLAQKLSGLVVSSGEQWPHEVGQPEDPTVWTAPFTGEYAWPRSANKVFEYACHEANYALEGACPVRC